MTVGERIRAARKAKKMTQAQLGKACDPVIAEPTIRRYELGKLNPKRETIEKIAKALDTDPLKLMGYGAQRTDAVTAYLENLGYSVENWSGESCPIIRDIENEKFYRPKNEKEFEADYEGLKSSITKYSLTHIYELLSKMTEIDAEEFYKKQFEYAEQRKQAYEEHEKKMKEFMKRLEEREGNKPAEQQNEEQN